MTMGFVKCSAMIVCGILYFLDCDKLTWHIEIEGCKIEVYTSSILKMHFIFVRTRFVADRNGVGFAREKALTISFVERGFERLGLDR